MISDMKDGNVPAGKLTSLRGTVTTKSYVVLERHEVVGREALHRKKVFGLDNTERTIPLVTRGGPNKAAGTNMPTFAHIHDVGDERSPGSTNTRSVNASN